jgi:hypothetical protein
MLAFAVEEAWTRDGAEATRIAPMATLHIAIMCLARRSACARMLLHQEAAACGSNALAHADASLMAPGVDPRVCRGAAAPVGRL